MKKLLLVGAVFFPLNASSFEGIAASVAAPPATPLSHLTRIMGMPAGTSVGNLLVQAQRLLKKKSIDNERKSSIFTVLIYYWENATQDDLGPFGEREERLAIQTLQKEAAWLNHRIPSQKKFDTLRTENKDYYLLVMKCTFLNKIILPFLQKILISYSTPRSAA